MKWILAIVFSISSIITVAQSDEKRTERVQIIDEATVSFNYTTFRDANTTNGWGLGAGIYRSFFRDKRVALNVGFEFNRTSQFKKSIYESHFSNTENVTYYLNNLSIPVSARVQFGSKTVFFIETGGFIDILLAGTANGTRHSYMPDENDQVVFTVREFHGKAGLNPLNAGLSVGLGLKIPIKQVELVIRPDYRYGFVSLQSGYSGEIYNEYARISLGISWGR